jgi:hypothetical protein
MAVDRHQRMDLPQAPGWPVRRTLRHRRLDPPDRRDWPGSPEHGCTVRGRKSPLVVYGAACRSEPKPTTAASAGKSASPKGADRTCPPTSAVRPVGTSSTSAISWHGERNYAVHAVAKTPGCGPVKPSPRQKCSFWEPISRQEFISGPPPGCDSAHRLNAVASEVSPGDVLYAGRGSLPARKRWQLSSAASETLENRALPFQGRVLIYEPFLSVITISP